MRAANVGGSVEERIFYQALIDRGLIDGVDFTYQASEFGGRAELGGLVADFMFPHPKVVVQVQSYWHRLSLETETRDTDQTAILQAAGYVVLEIWGETINDAAALEVWMERNVSHLWGTSATPLTGSHHRDEAFLMSTQRLTAIEQRLNAIELALQTDVVMETEMEHEVGEALAGLDVRGEVDAAVRAINIGGRLAVLENALFSGGGGGPAVRISSAYIAQHLSSTNFATGVSGWRISKDGSAEFQDLTARGSMQSSDFVSGSTGWKIYVNGNAEFHDVTVRGKIIASTFQYDATSALGGILMVGPATTLAAHITDAATTITVEDAQFADNDFLYVKCGGTYEVMKVTAGGGTTSLTVTRGVAGTATAWKKGTAIARKGDRIVLDTVSANSPYLDIIDWSGPLHTNETTRVRLGNLAGISDPNMTPTGYGLYSDNVFLTGTAVFGGGDLVLDENGITIATGVNDENIIKWLNGADVVSYIESFHALTDNRTWKLLMEPYADTYQCVITLGIKPYDGGGYEGGPNIVIAGRVGDSDANETYIKFNSDSGGMGGGYSKMSMDSFYFSGIDLKGLSSSQPALGSTVPAEKWGDVYLKQGSKIYWDDDNDSYAYASGDDSLSFLMASGTVLTLTATGATLPEGAAIAQTKKITFDTDLDLSIRASADDVLEFEVGGVDTFILTGSAIKSEASIAPDLGSITAAEKWGSIYMAVGKDAYALGNDVGCGTRLDGFATWDQHFDGLSALPSGWAFAGAPFVTPTVAYQGSYLELSHAAAARSFLYRTHDGSTDTSNYLAKLTTNSNNSTSYAGVRVDNGGDSNYAEGIIQIASANTFTVDAAHNTGGAGRTVATGSTYYAPLPIVGLNCFGTRWSNWNINSLVCGLDIAGLWQMRPATVAALAAGWTPTRQGIVINWQGAAWHRWYLDAWEGD